MSITSSEYSFPIFISSTDYNLIDLRAELAKYLFELGYKPILSSSDGFPDSSPDYAPWESCLQVLQSSYVMVLIIDDKYGAKFKWPNFEKIIGCKEVSPTHAEYLFAHKTKMRMLVFIRSTMLTHYQLYRNAMDVACGDKNAAKENLAKVLPKHIKFETLEFIEEVKKTEPIPWIKPFDNVTDIKKEIQRKLLNELAELFLFKSKHMEAVIREFSKVLDDLPEDKRKEILGKIGATKELSEKIENQTKIIQDLKKSEEQLEGKSTETTLQLEKAKNEKKVVKNKLEHEIVDLRKELYDVKSKIGVHENVNADYLVSGSTAASGSMFFHTPFTVDNVYSPTISPITVDFSSQQPIILSNHFPQTGPECEKCHASSNSSVLLTNSLRHCPSCDRELCSNCFNGSSFAVSFSEECAECRAKKPKAAGFTTN